MESYALPVEVVAVLDDAALVLTQLLQADILPVVWEEALDGLAAQLVAVREKHVWDGTEETSC